MGDSRTNAYFEVEQTLETDAREFEVERFELNDVIEAGARHVPVRAELPKLRLDLLRRQ